MERRGVRRRERFKETRTGVRCGHQTVAMDVHGVGIMQSREEHFNYEWVKCSRCKKITG